MSQTRDTRLVGLAALVERAGSAKAVDRCALSARAKVCALVRDVLVQSGIDPKLARALYLTPHLDPPAGNRERKQFEEVAAASENDGLAGVFAAKIGGIARRYQDGLELDLANASLAELLAWCMAQPARNPERPA